jgi:hypothetical protein
MSNISNGIIFKIFHSNDIIFIIINIQAAFCEIYPFCISFLGVNYKFLHTVYDIIFKLYLPHMFKKSFHYLFNVNFNFFGKRICCNCQRESGLYCFFNFFFIYNQFGSSIHNLYPSLIVQFQTPIYKKFSYFSSAINKKLLGQIDTV